MWLNSDRRVNSTVMEFSMNALRENLTLLTRNSCHACVSIVGDLSTLLSLRYVCSANYRNSLSSVSSVSNCLHLYEYTLSVKVHQV